MRRVHVITLRYFPMLGRMQALRHALTDSGLPFEEVRAELSEWPGHRDDPSFAGPFAALPTLTWDGEVISETLPIASFLARRLGHYATEDGASIARADAISSCCLADVTIRLSEVLYADLLYPGGDVAHGLALIAGLVLAKLDRVERLIPASGWTAGARPTMPDFFAGEAFEVCRHVLGPARDAVLAERFPRLTALTRQLRERPSLAKAWATRPSALTARPDEAAALERLRAVDIKIAS